MRSLAAKAPSGSANRPVTQYTCAPYPWHTGAQNRNNMKEGDRHG
jgi:hypothetical protein